MNKIHFEHFPWLDQQQKMFASLGCKKHFLWKTSLYFQSMLSLFYLISQMDSSSSSDDCSQDESKQNILFTINRRTTSVWRLEKQIKFDTLRITNYRQTPTKQHSPRVQNEIPPFLWFLLFTCFFFSDKSYLKVSNF